MTVPTVKIDLLLDGDQARRNLSRFGSAVRTWGQKLKLMTTGVNAPIGSMINKFQKLATILKTVAMGLAQVAAGFAGLGVAAAAGFAGIFIGLNMMAKMGETAELAMWKTKIIFDEMEGAALSAAATIADDLNWSITTVLGSLSRVADIIKPLGMEQEKALRMSVALTKLTSTAPQWTIGAQDPSYGLEAMTKAMVGEKEMLKELGIVILDKELEQEIKDAGYAVTALNKAIATYNLIGRKAADMIKASGTRVKSYTLSIIEAKEAFKILGETVGKDLKEPFMEFFYTVGALVRRLADLWETPLFQAWNDQLARVTTNLRIIGDALRSLKGASNIELVAGMGKVLTALKKMASGMISAVGSFLMKMFAPVMKAIGYTLGYFIWQGAKDAMSGAKFDPAAAWGNQMMDQFIEAGTTLIAGFADAIGVAAEDLKPLADLFKEDKKDMGIDWKEEDFVRGVSKARNWSTLGFTDMYDKILDAGLNAGEKTIEEKIEDNTKKVAEDVPEQKKHREKMEKEEEEQTETLKRIEQSENIAAFGR